MPAIGDASVIASSSGPGHAALVEPSALDAIAAISPDGQLVRMRWSQGELGRPGDNLYQVTFVAARPHKLLIEFDEQVLAVLTEPRVAQAVCCRGRHRLRAADDRPTGVRRHDAAIPTPSDVGSSRSPAKRVAGDHGVSPTCRSARDPLTSRSRRCGAGALSGLPAQRRNASITGLWSSRNDHDHYESRQRSEGRGTPGRCQSDQQSPRCLVRRVHVRLDTWDRWPERGHRHTRRDLDESVADGAPLRGGGREAPSGLGRIRHDHVGTRRRRAMTDSPPSGRGTVLKVTIGRDRELLGAGGQGHRLGAQGRAALCAEL